MPKNQTPTNGSQSEPLGLHCLLGEQKAIHWEIFNASVENAEGRLTKPEVGEFLWLHALNIHEIASAVHLLMERGAPYTTVLLSRSALESAFSLAATVKDKEFAPQRAAFELEDLARKIDFLIKKQSWEHGWKPSASDCLHAAAQIRQSYGMPAPEDQRSRDRISKIERIAEVADMTLFYDDDYRLLSLAVHGNQAGILNAASGFLVRRGMLALSHSLSISSEVLCLAFGLSPRFRIKLHELKERLIAFMEGPEFKCVAPM